MDQRPDNPPPVQNLERKARLLLVAMLVLVGGAIAYLMYARGVFERTQEVVLIADDSEGIAVGMNMTFSGFPIGRVGRIELSPEGNARIIVNVPHKDAHWLRTGHAPSDERRRQKQAFAPARSHGVVVCV